MLAATFTGGASVAAVLTARGSERRGARRDGERTRPGNLEGRLRHLRRLVQRVGTMVQPGDSAIFALLRTIDPDVMIAQFKGYGGTILRTTLSETQGAKAESTLHGDCYCMTRPLNSFESKGSWNGADCVSWSGSQRKVDEADGWSIPCK
jgi:hypothetical protein